MGIPLDFAPMQRDVILCMKWANIDQLNTLCPVCTRRGCVALLWSVARALTAINVTSRTELTTSATTLLSIQNIEPSFAAVFRKPERVFMVIGAVFRIV